MFFFDDTFPQNRKIEHWSIMGTFDDLLSTKFDCKKAIVAIGHNKIRNELGEKLIEFGFSLPVLIHTSAIISKYPIIGKGSVVFANAVVNAFACIGNGCIINTNALIEHDCILGDWVHISPNAALAGGTKVGDFSWMGIGSITKQLIEVGDNTIIGANSTVISNIPSNVIAVGSPAVINKF